MRLQVKGRHVEVTDALRDYAEAKLAKMEKLLPPETAVEIELSSEAHHPEQIAEGLVFTKGPTLRAHETASDLRAAIDRVADNLERQVGKYREKRRLEPRRRTAHHGV